VTFYQEYEQPSPDDVHRRNRRWMIGIFVVVGLMVVSAVVGAAAASGSHSNKGVAGAPAKSVTTTTTRKRAAKTVTTAPTRATVTTRSPASTGTTASGGQKDKKRATLVPGRSVPSGATSPTSNPNTNANVTVAPASPAVINAYIAAFREECRSIWSHADGDGLLWDPDVPGSKPHTVNQCYAAIDPADETLYDDAANAQQYAHDNADSAVEDMTAEYRLRSTKGVVFDVP
jgi:hypothetical protein